jgi:hypothetical protein
MLNKLLNVYPCTTISTVLINVPLALGYYDIFDLPSCLGIAALITGASIYFRFEEVNDYEMVGKIIETHGVDYFSNNKRFKKLEKLAKIWELEHPGIALKKQRKNQSLEDNLEAA